MHTPAVGHEGFWHHVRFPTWTGTGVGDDAERYNETLAKEMRGDFDWLAVDKWDMNLREKLLKEPEHKNGAEKYGEGEDWYEAMLSQVVWRDWAWVKGSATVYAHSDPATVSPVQMADAPGNDNNDTITITDEEDSVNYEFIGLHYIPTGSYALFGMPDGRSIDIRNIPRLFTDRHEAPVTGHASHAALLNASRAIVMRQLKADLQEAEDSLLLSDVPHEGVSSVFWSSRSALRALRRGPQPGQHRLTKQKKRGQPVRCSYTFLPRLCPPGCQRSSTTHMKTSLNTLRASCLACPGRRRTGKHYLGWRGL
jgi:hypothetical protein